MLSRINHTSAAHYFFHSISDRLQNLTQYLYRPDRYLPLILLVPLLLSGYAQTAHGQVFVESNLLLSPSFRFDELNWNIAGNPQGTNPNIAAESKWKSLKSAQLQLGSEILVNRVFYFRGSGSYSYTLEGSNSSADYAGDNRSLQQTGINSDADGSYLTDIDIAAGMLIVFYDDEVGGTLTVIPQLGYSVHEQNLLIKDSYQQIPSPMPLSLPESEYNSRWYGPWIGVALRFQASWTSAIHFRYQYHDVDYDADADWYLNPALAHPNSFEHAAEGTGHYLAAGWREELKNNWVYGVELVWQRWSTDSGTHTSFLSNSSTTQTRLNKVDWDSTSVVFTIGKFFPVF
jgi:hypothetical protein